MQQQRLLYYNPTLMHKKNISVGVALLLVIGVAMGLYRWWTVGLSAPSNSTEKKPFVIRRGEPVSSIAQRLADDGFIRDPFVFRLYLKKEGIGGRIEAGDYKLSQNLTVSQLVLVLQHGLAERWFTVIEGLRVEEIAQHAQETLGVAKEEFLNIAQEGYLFPDTYLIPVDADSATIAAIMRRTFEVKVDEKLRKDFAKQGMTTDEVVTLASLIEREARTDEERAVISGILRKRMNLGIPLQVDASLQYALGFQPHEQKTKWWKQNLTAEDKAIESPYNTYRYPGLPPGPICNPGLASIKAAVYPAGTRYLYYLHDKEGKVYYAETNEEHIENKRKAGLL